MVGVAVGGTAIIATLGTGATPPNEPYSHITSAVISKLPGS